MYVCICNNVTDRDIKSAVKRGCDSYEKICSELKVASCCGRCRSHAHEVLAEATNTQEKPLIPMSGLLTSAV